MTRRVTSLLAILAVGVACTDQAIAPGDENIFIETNLAGNAPTFRVMTRNIYVGANVDRVLAATSPDEVPVLVEISWEELLSTDFSRRAAALAEEVRIHRPHLIGLQEVSLIRTQSPGDAVFGGTTPAETVVFDFLGMLLAALTERGLDYRAVASVQNMDIEVPRANGLPPDDVRVTDFDVILAHGDVDVANAIGQNYATLVQFPVGGPMGPVITIPRGWTAVDATVGSNTYRFANTHLEQSSFGSAIQEAQAAELLGALANTPLPVVLVGDLNSQADGGSTATYGNVLAAGYSDTWLRKVGEQGEPGWTCCHDSDLRNVDPGLEKRIDFVFARPAAGGAPLDLVRVRTVGSESRERTRSGLWPSDHAGVVADFLGRGLNAPLP